MKILHEITELLHDEYGFDAAHPGPEILHRVVRERQEATGNESADDYLTLLQCSTNERQEFVERVTVPETYFFRHPESFTALVHWVKSHPRRPLRILSLACSTGEEPYSIAMTLLDAGVSPAQFFLEAHDINGTSIAAAERGIFSPYSIRTGDGEWRDRHLTAVPGGWKVSEEVRKLVRFRKQNLLELQKSHPWDAIFCRNVMIYFSAARQKEVINLLGQALARDGLLFLGPAEPPLFLKHGWSSSEYPMSFTCRKQDRVAPQSPPLQFPLASTVRAKKAQLREITDFLSPAAPAPPVTVERARDLADSGRLAEAHGLLAEIVRHDPSNAEAYYFSGIIAEAENQVELAENHYRKAIYLAPNHSDALLHMALLLRRQGRDRAAENLERRASKHTLPS